MVPDAHTGGPRFAAFCEHYVRHTKGRWARQPLVLEDWQRDFWWEALEFDPATGLRVEPSATSGDIEDVLGPPPRLRVVGGGDE